MCARVSMKWTQIVVDVVSKTFIRFPIKITRRLFSLFRCLSISFRDHFSLSARVRAMFLRLLKTAQLVSPALLAKTLSPPNRWWDRCSVGSVTETECMIYRHHYFTFGYCIMRHCITAIHDPSIRFQLHSLHALPTLRLGLKCSAATTLQSSISNEHNFRQQFIIFSFLLCSLSSVRARSYGESNMHGMGWNGSHFWLAQCFVHFFVYSTRW